MRSIEDRDVDALVALNNEHARELSLTDATSFRNLVSGAALACAVGPVGDPDAFLLAFDQDTPRRGPNHGWFLDRYPKFLYVDRVCVASRARRRGLARALYRHAFAWASTRDTPFVVCEVNVDPPNPESDAFHLVLGFREVGDAFLSDRGKRVRYLLREADQNGSQQS